MAIEPPNVVPSLGVFAFRVAEPRRSMSTATAQADRFEYAVSTVETIVPKRPSMHGADAASEVLKDCVV